MSRHPNPYQALAAAAAERHGIPVSLYTALIRAESGFNPRAVSPAGAIGLAQLLPGTAARLGVNPYDPAQNVEGGARYLQEQLARFGSPALALAAYNAGPGAVQKYGGIPPFAETQAYVARVLADAGETAAQAQPADPGSQFGIPEEQLPFSTPAAFGGIGVDPDGNDNEGDEEDEEDEEDEAGGAPLAYRLPRLLPELFGPYGPSAGFGPAGGPEGPGGPGGPAPPSPPAHPAQPSLFDAIEGGEPAMTEGRFQQFARGIAGSGGETPPPPGDEDAPGAAPETGHPLLDGVIFRLLGPLLGGGE